MAWLCWYDDVLDYVVRLSCFGLSVSVFNRPRTTRSAQIFLKKKGEEKREKIWFPLYLLDRERARERESPAKSKSEGSWSHKSQTLSISQSCQCGRNQGQLCRLSSRNIFKCKKQNLNSIALAHRTYISDRPSRSISVCLGPRRARLYTLQKISQNDAHQSMG